MFCLCCIPGWKKKQSVSPRSSFSRALTKRASSLYQIEHVDQDTRGTRSRNAQQLRMQLSVTEELTSETFGLELAIKNNEDYEAQDFFLFKEIIGSGSTAVVFRAMFKPTGSMHAVKFVPNFRTIKTMVMRELQVLRIANESRFLIDFHSHFRVGPNLYFVTEICEGGTLDDLLTPNFHLPAKIMKVYLKDMASGIFFLHRRKLVHRDISMENLFIHSSGHLKLGDFGLCRMVDDPSGEMMTDCGKPYIKAPEIYMDKPSGFPLDWWSVGILVYRFITGYYPFMTGKLTQGYHSVTKHREKYPEWAFADPHAKALCQGLLIKKPRDRLATENEEQEIKGHPYFQNLDWEIVEDIVKLTNELILNDETTVYAVAERLLSAVGLPITQPRLSVFRSRHSMMPPKKGQVIPHALVNQSNVLSLKQKKHLKPLNPLPRGDGNDETIKLLKNERYKFQETTV